MASNTLTSVDLKGDSSLRPSWVPRYITSTPVPERQRRPGQPQAEREEKNVAEEQISVKKRPITRQSSLKHNGEVPKLDQQVSLN